jgi:hypothetical protein
MSLEFTMAVELLQTACTLSAIKEVAHSLKNSMAPKHVRTTPPSRGETFLTSHAGEDLFGKLFDFIGRRRHQTAMRMELRKDVAMETLHVVEIVSLRGRMSPSSQDELFPVVSMMQHQICP